MPIFEYRCRRCEKIFEWIVLSASDGVNCPECGGGHVEKQLSIFSSPTSRTDSGGPARGCGCTPRTCGCH